MDFGVILTYVVDCTTYTVAIFGIYVLDIPVGWKKMGFLDESSACGIRASGGEYESLLHKV